MVYYDRILKCEVCKAEIDSLDNPNVKEIHDSTGDAFYITVYCNNCKGDSITKINNKNEIVWMHHSGMESRKKERGTIKSS